VDVSVRNNGWLPIPWLELHESLPIDLVVLPFKGKVISLGRHEDCLLTYTLRCRKRGVYALGPLTLRSGDLLGIEQITSKQVAANPLIVYPQIVPLHQLGLPTYSPSVTLPTKAPLFEDPTRITGVRNYVHGDSPRRIHWTATASAGRLLVKQYQPAIARETLICLNLNPADYEARQRYIATELAIVVAASVANHVIVKEGLPVGLATEAIEPLVEDKVRYSLPPRSERAHLMNMLEVLARAQIADEVSFADLIRRESVRLAWGATLMVVTGRESMELFDMLLYLKRAGFAVTLVLVQPGEPSDEMQKRVAVLNLPVHRIWRETDLDAW
jgi:uncharacterized protein (DUF58 family)